MDKKTIILVIILGTLTVFWTPIMQTLGLMEPPKPQTQTQAPDSLATSPDPGAYSQETTTAQNDYQAVGNASGSQPTGSNRQTDQLSETPADETSASMTSPETVSADTIYVETKKYIVALSTRGGGPVSIKLKEYAYPSGDKLPIEMLPNSRLSEPQLLFSSGSMNLSELSYTADATSDKIDAQSQIRRLTFTHTGADGATIQKIFTFYPDKYSYDLKTVIPDRRSFGIERSYQLIWQTGLQATELDQRGDYTRSFAMGLFDGGPITFAEDGFFGGDWEEDYLEASEPSGVSWIGKRTKYFTAIMIPLSEQGEGAFLSGKKVRVKDSEGEVVERKDISIGMTMPIDPQSVRLEDSVRLYVGPLDWDGMKSYDAELENMFDIGTTPVIGWLIKLFAIPIIWLLPRMYDIIGNYGVVIILLGTLIKLITWPLTKKTVNSMAAMKELQPQMEKLKEKHKNNPQALQKATMKLYKQAGVNPMASCMPTLAQMPLFFALFAVFNSTILFRGAPFILWWNDLSRGAIGWVDPYMILVVIMAGLMFAQQKISMTDPRNKAMVYIMPLVFGFMFRTFSSGLVLYWSTFSAFSLLEQLWGNRQRARQNTQVS